MVYVTVKTVSIILSSLIVWPLQMEKKAEKQAFPLPPGWRQLESERGIYFWHKETNRVQWKFPKEEG